MKKVLLILVAVMGMAFAANAQNNAIGVRLGGGQGYGAELSYQRVLGGFNRLEVDAGWRSYQDAGWMAIAALYQAHFNFKSVPSLGWYAGVGPRLDVYVNSQDAGVGLGICGQLGLDYQFSVPIQLSLDIRPCFNVIPSTFFYWGDFALGFRYTF
jgi:hypothetical protein